MLVIAANDMGTVSRSTILRLEIYVGMVDDWAFLALQNEELPEQQ